MANDLYCFLSRTKFIKHIIEVIKVIICITSEIKTFTSRRNIMKFIEIVLIVLLYSTIIINSIGFIIYFHKNKPKKK